MVTQVGQHGVPIICRFLLRRLTTPQGLRDALLLTMVAHAIFGWPWRASLNSSFMSSVHLARAAVSFLSGLRVCHRLWQDLCATNAQMTAHGCRGAILGHCRCRGEKEAGMAGLSC